MKQPGDYANIIVHREEVFWGRAITRFEWQGPESAPVLVRPDLLRAAGVENYRSAPSLIPAGVLPWPLRLVDRNFITGSAEYVRTDTGAGFLRWAWYAVRRRVSGSSALVFARFVMTLMVWNLAYVPEGERITWRAIGKRRP